MSTSKLASKSVFVVPAMCFTFWFDSRRSLYFGLPARYIELPCFFLVGTFMIFLVEETVGFIRFQNKSSLSCLALVTEASVRFKPSLPYLLCLEKLGVVTFDDLM